ENKQRASVRMSQYLQSWKSIHPFADLSNPEKKKTFKPLKGVIKRPQLTSTVTNLHHSVSCIVVIFVTLFTVQMLVSDKICFSVKGLLLTLAVVVYLALFLHVFAERSRCLVYQLYNDTTPSVLKDPLIMSGVWLVIFYIVCLILARRDEMTCRVDFLLERCFQTEREEMETMENVNRLLLQNVMPLHVASFFMGKALLSKPKFSSVEKIKTIGSTYMAAAGVRHCPVGEDHKV
ncbi:hypothetical protein GOODEAATRI_009566, partial [Goodea atripinnis]